MIWLTWRQVRAQTGAVLAVVAAFAVYLLISGQKLHDLARTSASVYDALTPTDHRLFPAGIVVVAAVPVLLGVFWGAPLVARELESGTHRLVWNQSVTRTRWLATKLAFSVLAGAVLVGVLTWSVTWWAAPIDGAASSTHGSLSSRLTPVAFAMRGVTPVAYTVFVMVLGAAVGLVLRRTLPAMGVTLALMVLVQIAVPMWVRPHLQAPVTASVPLSRDTLDGINLGGSGGLTIVVRPVHKGDWVLSNTTVGKDGRRAAVPSWFAGCLPRPDDTSSPGVKRAEAPGALESCFTRLAAEGYSQRLSYQPATRFWSLQWRESALFLGVSGLLTAFCFWWTRRRLS